METVETLEAGMTFFVREDLFTEYAGCTFEATLYDPNDRWYSGYVATMHGTVECSAYAPEELTPASDQAERHAAALIDRSRA